MIEHENDKKLPEQVERFIDNYNKSHNSNDASMGNVYHIISEDINGNVTNECFALNVITNAGMTKYKKSIGYMCGDYMYDEASTGGIFLGVGTGTPSITDTTLFKNAPYTTPTKDKYAGQAAYSYKGNWYNVSYDPNTESITQRMLISVSVFDYNLVGITEDMTITEIGIGPSITNLYFHALVYDSEGNVSSFVKNINEKLTINIYSTISIKASIFSDLYDKGVYACFQPGTCLHKGSSGFFNNNNIPVYSMTGIKPLCSNNGSDWYRGLSPTHRATSYYSNRSLFDNNATVSRDNVYQTELGSTGSYTITNQHQNIDKITMYFRRDSRNSTEGVWIYPNLGDGVTEEIVSTNVMTNGIYDMGLDFNFGGIIYYESSKHNDYCVMHHGHIPVGDINISSLKMFNYKTGEYDIPVNVVDNDFHPEARYNMNRYTEKNIPPNQTGEYITPDLTFMSGIGFVMINENTTIPIKRFWCDNDSSVTVKATDTFWDTSSFITIPNKNDVSRELGTKRYYIFNKAPELILRYLDRDQKFPTVLPNEQPKSVWNFEVVGNNLCYDADYLGYNPFISSDNLEYITNGLGIFYPETYDGTDVNSIVSYKFTNIDKYNERVNTYFIDNTSNGDIIIRVSRNSDYNKLYFHFIQVGDSSTTPITHKYEYPEAQKFVPCISLSREHGILALQNMIDRSTQATTAYIIKIYDDEGNFNPSTITLTDIQHCRVIYGTTKYAYVDLTNGESIQINIADALTNTIEDTFTIDPIKYTEIDGVLGWKNHIYICAYDSEYVKYVTIYHNIDTKTTKVLDNLNTHYVFSTSIGSRYYTGYDCSYIDECICINPQYTENSDETLIRNLIITDNNPTSPIPISYSSTYDSYSGTYYNNSTFPNYNGNTIQVKKVNNGKNIILMKMNSYRSQGTQNDARVVINDIGSIIYDNTQIKEHCHRQNTGLNYNYTGTGSTIYFNKNTYCCLYKDSVHQMYVNNWSSSPFEAWELMKMVGTTTTIQSYNNPKNIGYDNFPVTIEVTNNPELWS